VSAPVVYDHFASKQDLFERLLVRTRDELLEMWRAHLFSDEPAAVRVPRAFEAWAEYVERARMYFREATGVPEVQAFQRRLHAQARTALGAILGREPGAERVAGLCSPTKSDQCSRDAEALEMAAQVIRSSLTGPAIWWSEHPHVPREQIVATAVNVLWAGFERAGRG
jgi:AcrR family transcriptional regulator